MGWSVFYLWFLISALRVTLTDFRSMFHSYTIFQELLKWNLGWNGLKIRIQVFVEAALRVIHLECTQNFLETNISEPWYANVHVRLRG